MLIKPGYNRLNRSRVLRCGQDGRYLPEESGWCYSQYLTHAEVCLGGGGALFLQQCTMQCMMHMHDAMQDAVHDAVHGATGAPEEERPRLGSCLRERVRLRARRRLALRRCQAGGG